EAATGSGRAVAHVALDGVEFCRLAAGHVQPREAAAGQDGGMDAGHEVTPEQLVAVGRDVECQALARAVKWHAEHRILLNGHRTVVFA
ncbi:hypothetical protein ADL27_37240, partial [Streptomyces sp. NRRL F-6602]